MKKRKANYKTVLEKLEKMLLAENYRNGEKLPSVQALSKEYEVSSICVWQAINILKSKGVLYSIPKSGIYVKNVNANLNRENDERQEDATSAYSHDINILTPAPKIIKFNIRDRAPYMIDFYKDIIKDYALKNPYVKIELVSTGDLARFDSHPDNTADIIQIPSHYLDIFKSSGQVIPLADKNEGFIDNSAFFKSAIEASCCDGKLYGVPLIGTPLNCIFYKKKFSDLLSGLDSAGNFWEAVSYLKGLSSGKMPQNIEALLVTHQDPFSYPLMAGEPLPHYYEDLLPLSAEYKKFYKRFYPYFSDNRIFWNSKTLSDMTPEKLTSLFFGEKTLFFLTNLGFASSLAGQNEYDVKVWPLGKKGRMSTTYNINCLTSVSRFPSECLKFLKYLSEREIQSKFASCGVGVSRSDSWNEALDSNIKINWEKVSSCMGQSVAYKSAQPEIDTIRSSIIFLEFYRWQIGEIGLDELDELILSGYNDFTKSLFRRMNILNNRFEEKIPHLAK